MQCSKSRPLIMSLCFVVLWSRFVRLWNWRSSVKASSCRTWSIFWTVIILKSWCWALTAALHWILMLWMGCRLHWHQGCTQFAAHVELEGEEKIIREKRYVQKTTSSNVQGSIISHTNRVNVARGRPTICKKNVSCNLMVYLMGYLYI